MFWEKSKKEIQDQLSKISEKMERHDKENDVRLDNIEKVLIVQEQNLKTHMRRSDHLEEVVEMDKQNLKDEIEPIKKHINMVQGAFKLLGTLGILTSIIGGILKIMGII